MCIAFKNLSLLNESCAVMLCFVNSDTFKLFVTALENKVQVLAVVNRHSFKAGV